METLDALAAAVEANGYDVEWYGPASASAVEQLQHELGLQLPPSFIDFLVEYGGGGLTTAAISGIWRGDPFVSGGATTWTDTSECRSRFGLPEGLAVIYFDRESDEVCWCIDCRNSQRGDWPVVSYDVFRQRVDRTIGQDFGAFIRQHLKLRAS